MECLVSTTDSIKESMLESNCTLTKDISEALDDTEAMTQYLEKPSELHFSVTKEDAGVNGEVEYCHGKLDVRSSEVELEPIETSKMEVIYDEELDSMVQSRLRMCWSGFIVWFLVFRCVSILQGQGSS